MTDCFSVIFDLYYSITMVLPQSPAHLKADHLLQTYHKIPPLKKVKSALYILRKSCLYHKQS